MGSKAATETSSQSRITPLHYLRNPRLFTHPIFNTQPRHTFKLSHVAGNQNELVGKGVRSNPQVVVADGFAAGLQVLANFP